MIVTVVILRNIVPPPFPPLIPLGQPPPPLPHSVGFVMLPYTAVDPFPTLHVVSPPCPACAAPFPPPLIPNPPPGPDPFDPLVSPPE